MTDAMIERLREALTKVCELEDPHTWKYNRDQCSEIAFAALDLALPGE